jgi:glycosyltransferase involved in cell wall biosynthesis
MKVLHITNWYPNEQNPKEAIWIQRHINSLESYADLQFILHLEVKLSTKLSFIRINRNNLSQRILSVPIQSWFILELLSTLLLCLYLIKVAPRKRYDIINFHIAYPILTYWHLVRKFVNLPIVITEHWSAYHFNFNIKDSKKLSRIKRIFQQSISVIAVSEALSRDVQSFSEGSFPAYIVPNVVSDEFICCSLPKEGLKSHSFFMVSNWKWPKRPDVAIDAFCKFVKELGDGYKLRIGGAGCLLPEMKKQVARLGITDQVEFLGILDSAEIAEEMRKALAFIHCSEYETFSVVCAEALSTGCPVIASSAGGMKELVNTRNGVLVKCNDENSWLLALKQLLVLNLSREKIAKEAAEKFSKLEVGRAYYKVLSAVVNENYR